MNNNKKLIKLTILLLIIMIIINISIIAISTFKNNKQINTNNYTAILSMERISKNLGNEIFVDDICSIIIQNWQFTDIISPLNNDLNYSYFVDSKSNKYIEIKVTIKNMHFTTQEASMLCDINILYDDKYIYDTRYLVQKEKRLSIYESIKPLEEKEISFIAEVPKILYESENPLKLLININNNGFEIILR